MIAVSGGARCRGPPASTAIAIDDSEGVCSLPPEQQATGAPGQDRLLWSAKLSALALCLE